MEQEELARESLRVLALLELADQEQEKRTTRIPPPPRLPRLELVSLLPPPVPVRQRRVIPPPPRRADRAVPAKDVRYKLAEAWVLLTECREAVHDWRRRSSTDVGLRPLEARIDHALGMVDDAIHELEPPTDRLSSRPPRPPSLPPTRRP